jgi:phosphatidylglycerophosphate synthase
MRSATFLPNFAVYRTHPMSKAPTITMPTFVPVGSNPARAFGLDARTRACRLAAKAGMECADTVPAGQAALLADLDFAWDPAWLKSVAGRPGAVLELGGRAVLAHIPAGREFAAVEQAMLAKAPFADSAFELLDAETAEFSNKELRKRERPFVLPLDPADTDPVERAAYDASYKGVTDALTLYLWRKPAFYLTRWAARAGLSPNQITLVGAALCIATVFLFATGWYWLGMATGFGFMVLDTVDGKLARCTGQSSWWGNIFDHGIDLIHPPFWWWAWAEGLNYHDDPFERVYEVLIVAAIVFGYVVQRVIEGIFMRRYGMHIHVWQPIDSKFRLVTARRNPNMIILLVSLVFRRPDMGLELVALWTVVSLIFHAVRLVDANARWERGAKLTSWLA